VFFTTADPLVPTDTNTGVREFKLLNNTIVARAGYDVYEYAEGRPQLITSGTGSESGSFGFASESTPGLYGVSANGTDVYFGSQEPLVPQDQNGVGGVRFYDARTGGGFSVSTAVAPCRAADECHGATAPAPERSSEGTAAPLGEGGNAPRRHAKKHGKKKHAKKKHAKKKRHHPRHRRTRRGKAARHQASRQAAHEKGGTHR
jgi:hypothetical protein